MSFKTLEDVYQLTESQVPLLKGDNLKKAALAVRSLHYGHYRTRWMFQDEFLIHGDEAKRQYIIAALVEHKKQKVIEADNRAFHREFGAEIDRLCEKEEAKSHD